MKSHWVDRAKARLRYHEFPGQGTPLVMVHGLGCAASFEFPHVAHASALRDRHVLMVDLMGFGASDQPGAFGYQISDHALALADLIKARAFPTVDLFGHSMGGSVAIEAADLLRPLVRTLILSEANLDSGGGPFSRPIAEMGEAAYNDFGHAEAIAQSLREGDDTWATTLRLALPKAVFNGALSLVRGGNPSWRDRFLQHPARKAFVFGDQSLPDPDAEALASAGILVLVVPHAGHAMGIDNPSGLAEALAEATA